MDKQKELEVLSRLRVSLQGLNIMLEAIGMDSAMDHGLHPKRRT